MYATRLPVNIARVHYFTPFRALFRFYISVVLLCFTPSHTHTHNVRTHEKRVPLHTRAAESIISFFAFFRCTEFCAPRETLAQPPTTNCRRNPKWRLPLTHRCTAGRTYTVSHIECRGLHARPRNTHTHTPIRNPVRSDAQQPFRRGDGLAPYILCCAVCCYLCRIYWVSRCLYIRIRFWKDIGRTGCEFRALFSRGGACVLGGITISVVFIIKRRDWRLLQRNAFFFRSTKFPLYFFLDITKTIEFYRVSNLKRYNVFVFFFVIKYRKTSRRVEIRIQYTARAW